MTDLFKCKKSGTTCCAPKARVQEIQSMITRNDSFPIFTNPQAPQQSYPQPQFQQQPGQYNPYPLNPLTAITAGLPPPLTTNGKSFSPQSIHNSPLTPSSVRNNNSSSADHQHNYHNDNHPSPSLLEIRVRCQRHKSRCKESVPRTNHPIAST